MRSKNIVEVTDFTQKEWQRLIKEAISFKKNPHRRHRLLKNKRIALVFDSRSLRTKLSFETAVSFLGGSSYFVDIDDIVKEKDGTPRETYEDIIDTMDKMVDAYVLRDYSRKMFEVFKRKSQPPSINGFCQVGHPSQALADLSVIVWKKGTWKDLVYVGVCPATGSGVMESFVYGVLLLGQHITLVTQTGKFHGKNEDFHESVEFLCATYGGSFSVVKNSDDIVGKADVLYVDEWWENSPDFLNKRIGVYRVDKKFLKNSKSTLSIMHCLPAHPGREISEDVMRSDQSIIFEEAEFRIYSAMSLLSYLQK